MRCYYHPFPSFYSSNCVMGTFTRLWHPVIACCVTGNFPLPNPATKILLDSGPPPLLVLINLPNVTRTPWAVTLRLLLAIQLLAKNYPSGQALQLALMHPSFVVCDIAETLNFACFVILPSTTGCNRSLLFLWKNGSR